MLASVSRASRARRNSRARVCKSLFCFVVGMTIPSAWQAANLAANPFEQNRGDVTFAGIGQHGDDSLSCKFRQLGQAYAHGSGRAARNTGEDALVFAQPPRHLNGLLVGDLLYTVDHGKVQVFRNESRAEALDLVRRGRERLASHSLRNHWTRDWLNRHRENLLPFGFL